MTLQNAKSVEYAVDDRHVQHLCQDLSAETEGTLMTGVGAPPAW